MSTYQEASNFKAQLTALINEAIKNNPIIKSCLKAQKVVVWEKANTTTKTVKVKLIGDIPSGNTALELPYNTALENYLTNATPRQTVAWIAYPQSINNAVVAYDKNFDPIGGA